MTPSPIIGKRPAKEHKFSLRIDDEMRERLERLSRQRGVSVATFIRDTLMDRLAAERT